MNIDSLFSISLPTVIISSLFSHSNVHVMIYNIFSLSWWLVMLRTFSLTWWPVKYLLWKMSIQAFCPFLMMLLVLFDHFFIYFGYMIYTYFLTYFWLPFHFVDCFFRCADILKMRCSLICFYIIASALWFMLNDQNIIAKNHVKDNFSCTFF